jgi:hypothetical protein
MTFQNEIFKDKILNKINKIINKFNLYDIFDLINFDLVEEILLDLSFIWINNLNDYSMDINNLCNIFFNFLIR